MNENRFSRQAILKYSLIAESIGLFIAIFATGAGHGSYAPLRIIFPYTMMSTVFHENIRGIYMIFGLVQFPVYGLLLAWTAYKRQMKLMLIALIITHCVAVYFVFTNHNAYFPNIP